MSSSEVSIEEMAERMEDGRLPCAFSPQPVWEPILAQIDRVHLEQQQRKSAIASEQQTRQAINTRAQEIEQKIQQLSLQVAGLKEEEKLSAQKEETLQAEMEERERLNLPALRTFVQSAAEVEKQLILRLEEQLQEDRECLLPLQAEDGPKLGLLLNCFGSNAETISALKELSSMDLALLTSKEVEPLLSDLPRDQQITVLYTRERLLHGKLPFAEHDCAMCDCATAEEMSAFLAERGVEDVTADCIRKTGASGRGALLFLTVQELDIEIGTSSQAALVKARSDHRKK